ncbi:uncharacterized protein H6S33_009017 [Morchella sextelata]|uniref:uncharacterized protein n=1 Tax=Morchella sextelata TaxID=1174677 RepID=UPI001D05657F|nr:uncharacterized protein H6S33_009017 [Morchella sextelata]KAH0612637.1 hypothetical protein H6S33_009017 [Morchella sextelata]
MDATGFAIAALREVYNIAVFIKTIYTDSKNYDSDKDEISFKLSHELEVLRLFDRIFFDPATGVVVDERMAGHLDFGKEHITSIIVRLRDTLEIYRNVGKEHFDVDVQDDDSTLGKREAFKKRLADLKKKSWSWSLFDKGRLLEVVASFKESTVKLKEIYFLIMLDSSRGRGTDNQNLQQIRSIDPSLASGLMRQEIAWKVETKQEINVIEPLKGDIEPVSGQVIGDWAAQRVWKYCEGSKESLVTVEYKRYRPADILANDKLFPDQKAYMRLVRDRIQALATILQDPFGGGEAGNATATDDHILHTFKALGYIDRVEEGRFALLFEIPKNALKDPGPVTLAQFLGRNGSIQLEERFFLAHCLGTTLFTLHSSGWLHKNLSSSQVVLVRSSMKEYRIAPYLTGFEYSRPADERTDGENDYDVRRNLYRHPHRQGYPREDFRPIHDLFSFGVLLLEIGLRRTMVTHFEKYIQDLEKRGELAEPDWFGKEMIKLAEKKLAEAMGRRYRDAVLACLKSNFGIESKDMSRSRLAIAFRDQVLVPLKAGMAL